MQLKDTKPRDSVTIMKCIIKVIKLFQTFYIEWCKISRHSSYTKIYKVNPYLRKTEQVISLKTRIKDLRITFVIHGKALNI